LATLRHDEQADRRAAGHERLLDGAAAGHELFARIDQADGRRRRRSMILGGPRSVRAFAARRPGSRRTIERSRRGREWTRWAIERSGRAIVGTARRVVRPIAIRPIRLVSMVRPPGAIAELGPLLALPVRRTTAVARSTWRWGVASSRRSPGAGIERPAAVGARWPIVATVRSFARRLIRGPAMTGVTAAGAEPATIRA
jgi:hypothetical protein